MKNIKELLIQGNNLEEVYFIDDVVTSCKGVCDVDINEDTLEVFVEYDLDVINEEFLLEAINWAKEDYVGFYMELQRNDLVYCEMENCL